MAESTNFLHFRLLSSSHKAIKILEWILKILLTTKQMYSIMKARNSKLEYRNPKQTQDLNIEILYFLFRTFEF